MRHGAGKTRQRLEATQVKQLFIVAKSGPGTEGVWNILGAWPPLLVVSAPTLRPSSKAELPQPGPFPLCRSHLEVVPKSQPDDRRRLEYVYIHPLLVC